MKFNSVSATAFTVVSGVSGSEIKATVPAGATTGKITVTNVAGSDTSDQGGDHGFESRMRYQYR